MISNSDLIPTDLDGLPVMDDVGGISGHIDFLNTIHVGGAENHEDLRMWAQSMGWTGRMTRVENIL